MDDLKALARELLAVEFERADMPDTARLLRNGEYYSRSHYDACVRAIEAALSRPAGGECCVPGEGEPSFVLLGRDPQAPALIETWAAEREQAEPSSNKPGRARAIAAAMREFKDANPDKGMPAGALASAPTLHGGEDAEPLRDAPKGVELLALPAAWQCETAMCPQLYTSEQMQAYARDNVEASVAELRAEIERRSEEQGFVWSYLQKVSPWSESNDMLWSDEIMIGIDILEQRATDAEARAERLAEALREAQPFIGWTGSYPELHAKIDALLTTPAQPGETE